MCACLCTLQGTEIINCKLVRKNNACFFLEPEPRLKTKAFITMGDVSMQSSGGVLNAGHVLASHKCLGVWSPHHIITSFYSAAIQHYSRGVPALFHKCRESQLNDCNGFFTSEDLHSSLLVHLPCFPSH